MNIREQVLTTIIDTIKAGTVPWMCPYFACRMVNGTNDKPYRGLNTLLLAISADKKGYSDPRWATFKQAKKAKHPVNKGETATRIVFFRPVTKEDPIANEIKTFWIWKVWSVFNFQQMKADPGFLMPARDIVKYETDDALDQACKDLLVPFKDAPPVEARAGTPCYVPSLDVVYMPEHFNTQEERWSTLFHEYAHSTGHKTRLDRLKGSGKRTNAYAREELIAELTAAFVGADVGLARVVPNNAAYLAHWCDQLGGNPSLLIEAASPARKAADYMTLTRN